MCQIIQTLGFLGLAIRLVYGDVTFNVVGFPSIHDGQGKDSMLAVSVNNQWTKLTTTPETYPLWSGVVQGVNTPLNYQYGIIDGEANIQNPETFLRELKDGTQSRNDFFHRPKTITIFPGMPDSLDTWVSMKPKIFEDGKIGTFHLTGDPISVKALHTGDIDGAIKVDLSYIHPDFTATLKNVSWEISGQSSRLYAKQSYKLKFKDSGEFFSTQSIKLRAEETDPTMMREKIYIDLLNSFGVASIQANWARLYVNKQPVGLFLMTDDVKAPFIKRMFHGGDSNGTIGPVFKCNAIVDTQEANLAYKGEDLASYDFQNTYEVEESPDGKEIAHQTLIDFMKSIQDFNPINDSDLKKFRDIWDYPHFLRAMALEFLAGSWDTFWWAGSNYYLYKPPGKPWIYIPTDFDFSFGSDYPNTDLGTYQEFSQGRSRPPIDKLLAVPKIKKDFEEMLQTVTNHAFNSDVLNPRIDGYLEMLQEELLWDRGLTRLATGKSSNWSFQSAVDNVAKPIPTKEFGLKPWIANKVKLLQTQLNYKQKTEQVVSKAVVNSTSTDNVGDGKGDKKEVHTEDGNTYRSSSTPLVYSLLLLLLSLATLCI